MKFEEEEKVSKPNRLSTGSVNIRSDSDNGGDLETQVESIRTS